MQKSRVGGSEIHEKITSGGKLGPNLMLSWLVRAQVGAKRGNLTLLGGLRGTKLALKGALGALKEAPREAKRAMVVIGRIAVCLIFWPAGRPN